MTHSQEPASWFAPPDDDGWSEAPISEMSSPLQPPPAREHMADAEGEHVSDDDLEYLEPEPGREASHRAAAGETPEEEGWLLESVSPDRSEVRGRDLSPEMDEPVWACTGDGFDIPADEDEEPGEWASGSREREAADGSTSSESYEEAEEECSLEYHEEDEEPGEWAGGSRESEVADGGTSSESYEEAEEPGFEYREEAEGPGFGYRREADEPAHHEEEAWYLQGEEDASPGDETHRHCHEEPCSAESEQEHGSRGAGRRQMIVRARVATMQARCLAWAVDGALVIGSAAVLMWAAGLVSGAPGGLSRIFQDAGLSSAAALLAALMGAVYSSFSLALLGRSIGGLAAGTRVLDGRGMAPDLLRSSLRGLLAAGGVLALGAGLAWVLMDERGQTLHDRLAGTFVVED